MTAKAVTTLFCDRSNGSSRYPSTEPNREQGRMPYEYRKLTAQQREAVVHQRRAQGLPLHAPPHPFRNEGTYIIRAANFEHQPLMNSAERRTQFQIRLLDDLKELSRELIAWVILPNHYHVLLNVASLDYVSTALWRLHGSTSREWNIEDDLTGKRRVWYKFEDRAIRNESHLRYAFNYIHYNPEKHGYVDVPHEWPWSSLPMYYEDKGDAWLDEQWRTFIPPSDFGKGWDD